MHKNLFVLFALLSIAISSFSQNIGDFTPIYPGIQTQQLQIPETHSFQLLIKTGDALTGGGTMPVSSDFTGYAPITGSSVNGYVAINSESVPGDVTVLDIQYNDTAKLWNVSASVSVDFPASVTTWANCSGTVTSWGTTITCEETDIAVDLNADGYKDFGWSIEIDPVTKEVMDYNNDGTPDKLWAMGRMKHENIAIAPDNKTVYYGNESDQGFIYKFICDNAEDLTAGTLYVMKKTSTTSGVWIQVPNATQAERNDVVTFSNGIDAFAHDRVEDVEVGPDGKVYFAVTSWSEIYRFEDTGDSIVNYEVFVSPGNYNVPSPGGLRSVNFGSPDNLAFDGDNNLWITQDGGDNHIWIVRPEHTSANPKLEIFANTPLGCEPTGITFSPDYRFMFISMQHTSTSNLAAMTDAAGVVVNFDKDATLVISRNENLIESDHGFNPPTNGTSSINDGKEREFNTYPNPSKSVFTIEHNFSETPIVKILDITGKLVDVTMYLNMKGEISFNLQEKKKGIYLVEISGEEKTYYERIVLE